MSATGRIEAARKQCELAERILAGAAGLGNHDARRLDLAAHDLDQTYEALQASVKSFCQRVEETDFETVSKNDLNALLKDGAGVALTDTQLLLYAAVVRHRIGGVQAFLLSADGEHRSRIAHEDLERYPSGDGRVPRASTSCLAQTQPPQARA